MQKELKTYYVKFRATTSEYDRIKRAAEKEGLRLSDYLRKKVFADDAKTYIVNQLQIADIRMKQIIFQLRKAGVNVNQIAHSCNAGYFISGDGTRLIEEINQMERIVRDDFQEVMKAMKGALEDGNNETIVSERIEKE